MRILVFALTLLCATLSHAIPAERGWHLLSLRGGEKVYVQKLGDEFGSWYESEAGNRFTIDDDGLLVPMSNAVFTDMMQKRKFLHEGMNQVITERRAIKSDAEQSKLPVSYKGSKRGLIILVQFADLKFSALATKAEFEAMFNEEGYSNNNHIGSVHDYFKSQSYGQFDLSFDVVGPVTMPQGYAYYGQNHPQYPVDARVATMVTEACKAVDDEVDFSLYDWDGDGKVEQVFFVFAGFGEHLVGATTSRLYPVMWTLENAYITTHDAGGPFKQDGVLINTFAMCGELASAYQTVLSGIGVACHEFSHCFGLPDIYDVTYSGTPSMGAWDLLDSGGDSGKNRRGEVPSPYTAYERMECGWLEPIDLDHPQFIKDMPCLQDEPVAYRIKSDIANEYFLLENRQHKGWDAYTGSATAATHGLLISHIDYDRIAWNNNQVNVDNTHPRITYFPADGRFGSSASEMAGDLFPGTTKNTSFTDTSSPAARLYNTQKDGSKLMHKPITDIVEENGTISFTFDGGVNFAKPTAYAAKDVTESGFTACWSVVEGVETYDLMLNKMSICLCDETMDAFMTDATGREDLSSQLDSYMTTPGWTGSSVFTSNKGMLLGTSSAGTGLLASPKFLVEGDINVKLNARVYNSSDSKTLTVSLLNSYGETVAVQEITMTTTPTNYELVFEDIKDEVTLNVAPSKRAYIRSLSYDYGKVEEANTIESITTNTYTFTDLAPSVYTYLVRAVRGKEQTQWSNKIRVEVIDPNATGIESIEDAHNGGHQQSVSGTAASGFFNLSGQRVSSSYRGIVIKDGKLRVID